jgi:hypothetical protein
VYLCSDLELSLKELALPDNFETLVSRLLERKVEGDKPDEARASPDILSENQWMA